LGNPDILKIREALETEKKEFGRFWLLERFFPPDDRNLWMEGVELLRNINGLVIDDIRDYILHGSEDIKNNMEPNAFGTLPSNYGKLESKKSSIILKSSDLRQQKTIKSTNDFKRKSTSKNSKKSTMVRSSSKLDKSFDSDDETLNTQRKNNPIKLDALRPPKVWNFPIEKVKKKDDEKKIEIRKVDPKDFYKDKRVTKFIKILNQVKINMMEYSAVTKKNIWQKRRKGKNEKKTLKNVCVGEWLSVENNEKMFSTLSQLFEKNWNPTHSNFIKY
jgi:hypothetical protein